MIRGVYRSDQIYQGNATALAPDLIIGYRRGYRASWATCLGDLTDEVLLDNDSAWSADHCADALEVPGVLFCNRPIRGRSPSLVDIAPSILAEFGLPTPPQMVGQECLLQVMDPVSNGRNARGQDQDRSRPCYDRAKRAAEAAGYSSVEEFIADCIEKEIQRLKVEEDEGQVADQLRGLGYIE